MKYFAYGSNMNSDRMKKRKICFSQRTHATLNCFRLEFNKEADGNPKKGYANIVTDKLNAIEGVLYEIQDSDISKLDEREGYPDHYVRINVTVQLNSGEEVTSITYIANPDKIKEGLKPSRDYLKHLLAAKDMLSEAYYKNLEMCKTLD